MYGAPLTTASTTGTLVYIQFKLTLCIQVVVNVENDVKLNCNRAVKRLFRSMKAV